MTAQRNADEATVAGFGDEWHAFDQTNLPEDELDALLGKYFTILPLEQLRPEAVGFDLGCGSGRWARRVALRVRTLYCIDASRKALDVAERNLADVDNCVFVHASVEAIDLPPASMDFGFALGVLHHVPDTEAGLRACARLLRPGAPLLVYLYYSFENRPGWYRWLWGATEILRRRLSRSPHRIKLAVTSLVAVAVYLPLARIAALARRAGLPTAYFPLRAYADCSLYTMRTDAYDRFGTRLEQRFTREQIVGMLTRAGFDDVRFSDSEPFWCAVSTRRDE
ncbi:MAG: class I SAM-dependent methyltransferase [Solirubrobacteraceae bacterium]